MIGEVKKGSAMASSSASLVGLSPRERILDTASTLFYEEGIHAVGVERIVSDSGHPRATLYRHFRGKEGLVLAYLEAEDMAIRAYCKSEDSGLTSQERLSAIFLGIADDAEKHHLRGCPFINAAAEYPDPDSAVRRAVSRHRDWFRSALELAFNAAGRRDARRDAAMLVLLRDATLVGSYLDDAVETRAAFWSAVRSVFGEDLVA